MEETAFLGEGGGLGSVLSISGDQMWCTHCSNSSDHGCVLPFHLAKPIWLQAPGQSRKNVHIVQQTYSGCLPP